MDMVLLNDKIVYPGHGVAVVDEIIDRSVAGVAIKFIKLNFLFKDMTILVPLYNIDSIGIRKQSSPEAVEAAMAELSRKPERKLETLDFTPSGWNKRNKEYQMKIQSGNLLDLVKIYRDLMHIAQMKDLSFGERTLLGSVEELIVQELKIIRDVDRELIVQDIRSPFKQLYFQDRSFVGEVVSAA